MVGIWECSKESEITGDKCAGWGAPKLKCSLSMPQAKFAFINSQSLDQQSVGSSNKVACLGLGFGLGLGLE